MKKILQISNYYPPHIGGIEQTAKDIANSCSEEYQIKTLCFNGDKGTIEDSYNGSSVVRVNIDQMAGSQQLSFDFGKVLKKIMNEYKPDIVIFNYPNPFQAHYLKKYLKHKTFKFIIWWHLDITKQKFLAKFFSGQNKFLLKNADKIVATSPNYIEGSKWLSKNKDKCVVIPSCVDEARMKYGKDTISKALEIKNKYNGKHIVFACGRHVEYKGMKYLIEASRYLSDDYKILIGGSGPLTESLKKEALNNSKIEFLGRISDEDLKAYLLACEVFAFPSITKNEAFGLSLGEALYYAKPSITFTIEGSGVNYVNLNNVTGLEVANKDSKTFAEAIIKIIKDKELYSKLSENAEQRAKELLSFDKFKENVLKLLKSL